MMSPRTCQGHQAATMTCWSPGGLWRLTCCLTATRGFRQDRYFCEANTNLIWPCPSPQLFLFFFFSLRGLWQISAPGFAPGSLDTSYSGESEVLSGRSLWTPWAWAKLDDARHKIITQDTGIKLDAKSLGVVLATIIFSGVSSAVGYIFQLQRCLKEPGARFRRGEQWVRSSAPIISASCS